MNNSFDRNYGMTSNSREFWGGDNGFVTVVVNLPTGVEVGTTAVTQDGTDAAQTARSAAERNLFTIVQTVQRRATIVATSVLNAAADPTVGGFGTVGGNVLAYAFSGTLASGAFAVTFLVERAHVFNKQDVKPGAVYNISIDPALEVSAELIKAGLFIKSDGTVALAATGTALKVYNALPAIVS